MNSFTPWVEKYRPTTFNDIVLDPLNKRVLENIITTNHASLLGVIRGCNIQAFI